MQYALLQYRSFRLFHETIPSSTLLELIEAETSAFGMQNDLNVYLDYVILRPRAQFRDNMVKRKNARWGSNAAQRSWVNCGLNPRPGTKRHTAGSLITLMGEPYVICLQCRRLRAGAS
ncbi:uncharacterized protein N7479_010985 [Penicillium vulpinum]|uniref:uncharacterized protein n=1 Tax=Penicillium vulpinum TaxID=29845 RepID=UPI0025487F35|nr:uncharacterized protein N7479_010985 [Penicillium vulpinum]KAJ5952572.1 hypothetical protein N7479_010985 [Penicillium vulpinum]